MTPCPPDAGILSGVIPPFVSRLLAASGLSATLLALAVLTLLVVVRRRR